MNWEKLLTIVAAVVIIGLFYLIAWGNIHAKQKDCEGVGGTYLPSSGQCYPKENK